MTDAALRALRDNTRDPLVQRLADRLLEERYDLRVLWHCYTTDNRPPMDLQERLTKRFAR